MNWIKEHEIDSWLLRGAVALMLLFPAFYSPYTDVYQSAYYAGFSWAYFLVVLYMAVRVWNNRDRLPRISIAAIVYFAGLLIYNLLSLYFNHKYLHWYWEQVNNTVAFLLLAVIAGLGEGSEEKRDGTIRFLMYCIILSNIGSIIYYVMGYTKLLICNNQFVLFELPENFYETRHYWLYSHKSEYAVMLVAFIALLVAYRKKFRSQLTFVAGEAVLLYCLYLTHSWTGIAGVFLIFAGYAADQIEWKHFRFKVGYIISAKDDIVSVTAPALGISWKFNGKDFCICGFYCIVNSCDLAGSACSGTEKPQTVVLGTYVHLFKQRIINSGDHESDCVKNCGPYKFGPCAVGADVMNIVYIHVEKSPFLLKTH